MKLKMETLVVLVAATLLAALAVSASSTAVAALPHAPPGPIVENWDIHHPIEFYGQLLNALADKYPHIAETHSIGTSFDQRDLWMITLTNDVDHADKAKDKIPIAIVGNIHGGEYQSGESAAYAAWWFATHYNDNKVAHEILDKYILYIVPVMNPSGYALGTRQPYMPMDHNRDNVVNNDPTCDINGDGLIGTMYDNFIGGIDNNPENFTSTQLSGHLLGTEGKDFDRNGLIGDDGMSGNIDMNRTFNYMWQYNYPPTRDE